MLGRIISIAVVLLILAGAAWALWPRPVGVDTALIGRGDLKVTVEEEGLARIREVFRVSAPVAGKLTRVAVHAGDKVALNQVVATIEPAGPGLLDERTRRIAEAAIQAAEAAVTLAEAGLSQAEAQNAYAQADLKRKVALADRGLVSSQIEQQATLAAATAQKSVDVATATLAMRRQDLEGARAALIEGSGGPSSTAACCVTVASPIDGEVLNVLNESELVVQPGTPLMDLGDPTNLEIVVDVLSTDAVRIVPHASATIEGWGGEPLRAEVERISPTAITKVSALGIEEQRTEVVLRLLDPPQKWTRLGHGFRVVAHIVVWEGVDSLLVPVGALFRRGEDWEVFLVESGQAKLRTIGIGERSDAYAEVTTGLAAGDVVILNPADTISDGTSVARLSPSG
ncbi:MAG: HlyD family efflux transporter periplasmic adaptor subunit [Devosia sp.]|uniref:efflux RND transporter periplasmic adaptor subunit n=1 Tax=Devosia sp. TaxID=1871048 RepID=UPI001AC14535|nr:HlyD family efflux transporter periplasmic adaptor subunit [Devosia sp.]MBN9315243.1 HlyD family efflux transporter periplasmic adaptor subunit [Devosia sp.]